MLHKQNKKNQQGFASMTVALILVLVLALLTVGFAQLARREQKNTLDKQLATQAYYAAESGINEVTHQLKTLPHQFDTNDPAQTNACRPTLSGTQVGNTGASYSCVLINSQPQDIVYSNVGPNDGRTITFNTTGITAIKLEWGSTTNKQVFRNPPSKFLPADSWGNTPAVIQLSLTPLNGVPNALNRDTLVANTFTVYLYPSDPAGGSNTTSYDVVNQANQAQVIGGNCSSSNGTYTCSSIVNGLGAGGATSYLLHVVDYYDNSNIRINGTRLSVPVNFQDAQAVVDVTGKAKDVLKRLQVRVPISGTPGDYGIPPDFVIQAGSACKRQIAEPTNISYDSNILPANTCTPN